MVSTVFRVAAATLLGACVRMTPQVAMGSSATLSGPYHTVGGDVSASADVIIPEFVAARVGVDVAYSSGGADALGNVALFNTPYRRAPEAQADPDVLGTFGWRFGVDAGRLAPGGAYEGVNGAVLVGVLAHPTHGRYLPTDEVFVSIGGRAGLREWMPAGTDRWALGVMLLVEWIHWRRAS